MSEYGPVGTFWASCSPRNYHSHNRGNFLGEQLAQNLPTGGAYYGKSAKSQELYSSQAPFVAASRGVEKVTLLLNSFPVKVEASPLSKFDDLGVPQ